MRDEDRIRIQHMADAAKTALEFVSGRSRQDLDRDRMLLFGVLRAIEVLGEAASRVSAGTRSALPDVPRAAVIAMRNRLIHGYFDIDITLVCKTVQEEIPALLEVLDSALRAAGN